MAHDTHSLDPTNAALIANNVYYSLKGWAAYQTAKSMGVETPTPGPGIENQNMIQHKVMGPSQGSLQGTAAGTGNLQSFSARSGFNEMAHVTSGFGYILDYQDGGLNHVVVATRGTRAEMKGAPDLQTDLRFAPAATFSDLGPVHKGFVDTFRSLKPALDARQNLFRNANCIHCVGHSLGGAVANLAAYYLRRRLPNASVRLYTFGAPRVGLYLTYAGPLERALGVDNIYRVSHTLDPITMIPIFPFGHILSFDSDENNIVLDSPASAPTLANHSMTGYIDDVAGKTWGDLRSRKLAWSWEDRMMSKFWTEDSNILAKAGKLTGGALLWGVTKILRFIAQGIVGTIVSAIATPLDLLAQWLYDGTKAAGKFAEKMWSLIKLLARAVGGIVESATDISTAVIRYLLGRLQAFLGNVVNVALAGFVALSTAIPLPPFFTGVHPF